MAERTDTAVGPRVALALLQQGLANCGVGSRGMIHATPYLANLWTYDDALVPVVVKTEIEKLGEADE